MAAPASSSSSSSSTAAAAAASAPQLPRLIAARLDAASSGATRSVHSQDGMAELLLQLAPSHPKLVGPETLALCASDPTLGSNLRPLALQLHTFVGVCGTYVRDAAFTVADLPRLIAAVEQPGPRAWQEGGRRQLLLRLKGMAELATQRGLLGTTDLHAVYVGLAQDVHARHLQENSVSLNPLPRGQLTLSYFLSVFRSLLPASASRDFVVALVPASQLGVGESLIACLAGLDKFCVNVYPCGSSGPRLKLDEEKAQRDENDVPRFLPCRGMRSRCEPGTYWSLLHFAARKKSPYGKEETCSTCVTADSRARVEKAALAAGVAPPPTQRRVTQVELDREEREGTIKCSICNQRFPPSNFGQGERRCKGCCKKRKQAERDKKKKLS